MDANGVNEKGENEKKRKKKQNMPLSPTLWANMQVGILMNVAFVHDA